MGPLKGYRIIELAGIGPGPFCAMMLADHGAEVIRVERVGGTMHDMPNDPLNRGKKSIALNLKRSGSKTVFNRLIESADVLIEGYRPGVTERLGIDPTTCHRLNPKLVYARMTGWGQTGPLAPRAGHDINYIALSGALGAMGPADRPPTIPLNLVGDFGGGAMFLAFGILSALLEVHRTGRGRVIDAAMTEGASLLMNMFHGMHASNTWSLERGENLLDGGAPFYRTYETADGKYMAVGALEPQFFVTFVGLLGIDARSLSHQFDRATWTEMAETFRARFLEKTQSEWTTIFEDTDACVTPVLSLVDAASHTHHRARGSFVDVDGITQPAPAPRYPGYDNAPIDPSPKVGEHTGAILEDLEFTGKEIAALKDEGCIPR